MQFLKIMEKEDDFPPSINTQQPEQTIYHFGGNYKIPDEYT